MKNLKITSSCLVKGQHVEAGTILRDVDTQLAADLLLSGRAEEVRAARPSPEAIVSRDPEVATRDQQPVKKKAKSE